MKRQRKTKYSYWKWVLLNKLILIINILKNTDFIVVHDRLNDKIFVYDIISKKIVIVADYYALFDKLFNDRKIGNYIEISQLEQFYKSLPLKYKKVFWDSIG